jgi:hypothetical protein
MIRSGKKDIHFAIAAAKATDVPQFRNIASHLLIHTVTAAYATRSHLHPVARIEPGRGKVSDREESCERKERSQYTECKQTTRARIHILILFAS